MQMLQHIFPVLCGIWMEIINKIGQSRPYFTQLILTFCRFDVDVSLFSLVISIALSVSDAGLDNWNVFVFFCYGFHSV